MMRRQTTLGQLARREKLLGGFFVAAAACLAFGKALGLESAWTLALAAGVAAAGPVVRWVLQRRQLEIEGRRESEALEGRTKAPIRPIAHVDPVEVGVEAAAQAILPGEKTPQYVPRRVDAEVQEALRAALRGEGSRVVVLSGRSKVGKSRTMFEALRACEEARELSFVAPVDVESLSSLMTAGEAPPEIGAGSILWLDDLEPFVDKGLTLQTLREWSGKVDGPSVVVATYGGKGSAKVRETDSDLLAVFATEILQRAREIALSPTSEDEVQEIVAGLPAETAKSIREHGLAAYLVAGAELDRKLTTHKHPGERDPCPEGYAVVRAVVDWARAGRTDSLAKEKLREAVWPDYLLPGSRRSEDAFEAGVAWALRPVAGSIALVEDDADGLRAFDYVVSLIAADSAAPRDSIWTEAVRDAGWAQMHVVGVRASEYGRYDIAEGVFAWIWDEAPDRSAVVAGFNLGVSLRELGRFEEEVAAYRGVLERFGANVEAEVRETVAMSFLNEGVALGKLDCYEDAVDVYDELFERFETDPEPAIRVQVSKGLVNKGFALEQLGRYDDAIAAYEEVTGRFRVDESAVIKEVVVTSLVNKGSALDEIERFEAAVAVYDEVLDRFGVDEEPDIRLPVAKCLVNKGVALAKLARHEDAIGAYDELVRRVRAEDGMEIREHVARARLGTAVSLSACGRNDRALQATEAAVKGLEGLDDPPEEVVAAAQTMRDLLNDARTEPEGEEARLPPDSVS